MFSKDIVKTITKIKNLKIEEEREVTDTSISLKIKYDEEIFFIFIKDFSNDLMVINVINPISFAGKIKDTPAMDLVNKFNTMVVGVKCILIDAEKEHYIFSREEFVRSKDVYNKELIESKLKLSISLVVDAVPNFENTIKDEGTRNEQEEDK